MSKIYIKNIDAPSLTSPKVGEAFLWPSDGEQNPYIRVDWASGNPPSPLGVAIGHTFAAANLLTGRMLIFRADAGSKYVPFTGPLEVR